MTPDAMRSAAVYSLTPASVAGYTIATFGASPAYHS